MFSVSVQNLGRRYVRGQKLIYLKTALIPILIFILDTVFLPPFFPWEKF